MMYHSVKDRIFTLILECSFTTYFAMPKLWTRLKTGYIFLRNEGTYAWMSKRQESLAPSTRLFPAPSVCRSQQLDLTITGVSNLKLIGGPYFTQFRRKNRFFGPPQFTKNVLNISYIISKFIVLSVWNKYGPCRRIWRTTCVWDPWSIIANSKKNFCWETKIEVKLLFTDVFCT
jgi:hypothetical protein